MSEIMFYFMEDILKEPIIDSGYSNKDNSCSVIFCYGAEWGPDDNYIYKLSKNKITVLNYRGMFKV